MKTIKLFALLATVLTLAACDKDKEETRHERDIVYTVAEQTTTTVHLTTEAEWDALLDQFCDYAEGGSSVTFRNANRTSKSATKEAVTYSTTDREEMKRWMAQMEADGKTVTVTYDSQTGTWNGTAYANASQPQPSGSLLTYECDQMNVFGYIWSFDTANHRVYITLHYTLQNITAPDYPGGAYEYVACEEVNSPFAYWLINSMGDTAGLYNLEFVGSDTLHFNATRLSNPVTLVRTDNWQTYLCSDMGLDIAMHVRYDAWQLTLAIAQMNSNAFGYVDCIWPFGIGRFALVRRGIEGDGDIPAYGLTLDFMSFGGNDVLEDYTIQGKPLVDEQFTITPGFSSCCSEYHFQRL